MWRSRDGHASRRGGRWYRPAPEEATEMTKTLVVVESPAKAKTIKKYLGKDFEVLASYGHVRDLVPKEGAVDPDHGFAMRYQMLEKNEKHVDRLSRTRSLPSVDCREYFQS